MDASNTFAGHFARLVWLIREDPADIEGQKAALRGLVGVLATTPIELDALDDAVTANGSPVLDVSSCMATLTEQMSALGVTTITIEDHAPPRDLLESARLLARWDRGRPAPTDLTSMNGPVRMSRRERPAAASVPPPTPTLPDPPSAAPPQPAPLPSAPSFAGATAAADQIVGAAAAAYEQFSVLSPAVITKVEQLLEQVATDAEGERLLGVLSKLTAVAERASNEGRMEHAVRVVGAIATRQPRLEHPRARRAFELAMFRLAQPSVLRAVAERLPKAGDDRSSLVAVLAATGEEGADAVIEQLVAASERHDRRVYFDTLVQLRSGIPTLLHMLGDARWYVVRNAAELLGELRVREAEGPLCELLHHDEERVRRSATVALVRVGGGRAMKAVIAALSDSAPDVRIQAAAALVSRPGLEISAALRRAIDAEQDERVLAAHLLSLGRLGDQESVERLIAYAAPRRGLFRPNATIVRLAAVDGLVKAKTPAAKKALAALEEDVDRAVRDAAAAARGH